MRRTDEEAAVLLVIRIMARTPHGSWPGSPHFGFRDYFEKTRVRPELTQVALQEINLSLKDLGIVNYRAVSIVKEAATNRDSDSYVVRLASNAEAGKTFSVGV